MDMRDPGPFRRRRMGVLDESRLVPWDRPQRCDGDPALRSPRRTTHCPVAGTTVRVAADGRAPARDSLWPPRNTAAHGESCDRLLPVRTAPPQEANDRKTHR